MASCEGGAVTPERQHEIRFGAVILVVPLVLLALVELTARWALPDNRVTDFDWRALRLATAATPEQVPSLFLPGSDHLHLRFNALGLRGPELDAEPAPGTVRLAVLGDSTVLNAIYPEEQTLAAQIARELAHRYPACSMEFTTFAGPAYSLSFLAGHWPKLRQDIEPDVTIMLTGSPYEAVGGGDERANRDYDWFEGTARAHFAAIDLFERVMRRASLTRVIQAGAEETPGFSDHIERSLDRMARDLATVTPDDTVIVVGHRARVRANLSGPALSGTTRHFRNTTGVKRPDAVVAVVERTVAAMREAAEARGWLFVDPLARVPADNAHFRDALHLSEQGIARLAGLLADEIRVVGPECRVEIGP